MALDKLPKEPMMLLSFVNTRLRDEGINPEELCTQFGADKTELYDKLACIGYKYNSELNRFV